MEFYVAVGGGAGGDGSESRPFGSLAQARDALRALRRRTPELRSERAVVLVRGGVYALQEQFVLTEEDSGTEGAPVEYRAASGEKARLSGGMALRGWRKVTDERILARLEPHARGRVWQTDLLAHGIRDFGKIESAESWAHSDPGLELFFLGRPMIPARYPNHGYMHIEEVLVKDGHSIHGVSGSRVGKFRYRDPLNRPARWTEETEIMLHGYWFWDWADQRIRLAGCNPSRREMSLDDSHPHSYGYRPGQWFYAYNLLCELDTPGEWYLDRASGILYFWPPSEDSSIGDGQAEVSVLRDPIVLRGAEYVTIRDLAVENARGTGIRVEAGSHVRIEGCAVRNVGGYGVWVEGGKAHTVAGCEICDAGDGGIVLRGGDRATLAPGRHAAVNNHVHHTGRWNPLYKVGIQLSGVGNRAAHNRVHDVPHVAIGFTGNDHVIECNEIYRAVTQANDAGMIYTTGAHPEEWTMRGHVIRHNFLHHSSGFRGRGCEGVYLDDMFSSAEIVGNVFWHVPRAILIGGGRDNVIANNIFADCRKAVHIDARGVGWAASTVPELVRLLDTVPYREEPWVSRYPQLAGILDDEPALPKGNVVVRNIFCDADWDEIEDIARPHVRIAGNFEAGDPGFADRARGDFRLKPDSPAWRMGFERIPLERIGLVVDETRAAVPPRQLIEAGLHAERPGLMYRNKCVRPALVRIRLQNLGETLVRISGRICACNGDVVEGGGFAFELSPGHECGRSAAISVNSVPVEACVVADVDGRTECWTAAIPVEPAAVTGWCRRMEVAVLEPGLGKLEGVSRLPDGKAIEWKTREWTGEFCNIHDVLEKTGSGDAVALFRAHVACPERMKVAALLGYDGPVRLFVDGRSVFHDPDGTNPALPDSARPEFGLSEGAHELVVMLGAGMGRAWGVFLRLQRTDLEPEQAAGPCVLPVWVRN